MSPSDNASLVPRALIWGEMRDPDFAPPALQGPPKESRAVNCTRGGVGQGIGSAQHLFLPNFFSLSEPDLQGDATLGHVSSANCSGFRVVWDCCGET